MKQEKSRNAWLLRNSKGKPVYLLGVTYMPRYCGDDPWEDWRPQDVRRELTRLKGLGLNCFRIFFYWHQLQPKPGYIDREGLRKIDEHVRIAHELGVYLMPTIAGHMGVHWYPTWAEGKHFYRDPDVVSAWRLMWRTIASRFKDETAIIAWDLANELEWFASPDTREQLCDWLKMMFDTIKEADPVHPVGYGPGGGEFAYSDRVLFEDASELGDYVGVHDYPYPHIMYFKEPQYIRLTYDTPFHLALASLGKPIMLQEYGINTLLNSEEVAAACFRTAMCSCLAQGSCGFLGWSWIDYDPSRVRAPSGAPAYTPGIRPLLGGSIIGQPLQGYLNVNMTLGIARGNSEWKSIAFEMQKFSRAISSLGIDKFHLPMKQAAVLIQTNAQDHQRGGFPIDLRRFLPVYLESFILSIQAKTNASIIRADTDLEGFRLIYLPGVIDLPASHSEKLFRWVSDGGVLYCSWAGMANDLTEIFGIKPEMPMPCRINEEMRFVSDLQGLHRGEILRFKLAKPESGWMRLSFLPASAEVVATDAEDGPALVRRKIGKGYAFFAGFSPEVYLATQLQQVRLDETWRLYRAIGESAGLNPLFDCQDPEIELGVLEGDHELALIVVNHVRQTKECRITAARQSGKVHELLSGLPVIRKDKYLVFTIEAFGAALLRCESQ